MAMPSATLQDHLEGISRSISGMRTDVGASEAARGRFDAKAFKEAIAASTKQLKSADQLIKSMLLKRAALQESYEAARTRGDRNAAMRAQIQLRQLEDQKQVIVDLNKLEVERNALLKKRNEMETKLADEKYSKTRGAATTRRALNEVNNKLYEASESYDVQVRTVRKLSEGIMDVKKAQELVNQELQEEQAHLEYMSKNLMGRLGGLMSQQFGEGFERVKSDIKDKLLMFTKIGAAVGFGVSAVRDLSKDSDEVINTLYRMGGSLDRVNNKMDYYTTSVLELNAVQTQLRLTAAAMNMPVEQIEGLTDQIMQSIRILNSEGKIDFKRVKDVSETALNFARRTGLTAQESVQMIAVLMNKYGDSAEKADSAMTDLVASTVTANDALEDLGQGKATIFIEDMANLLKEAADNSETFSLDLQQLGKVANNQMVIAKKFGATYNEALGQARTLTEYFNKRNPYTNYIAGTQMAKSMSEDPKLKPFIENKDVDGLTKFLSARYGLAGNEANIVAKAIIGKQGNWQSVIGQFMGGTKAGMQVVAGQLEKYAVQGATTMNATGGTDQAAMSLMAGTMGLDASSPEFQSLFNTLVNEARDRMKRGESTTGFINAADFGKGGKYDTTANKERAGIKGTEASSPITPTSLRETLQAVFGSPILRLITAGLALVTSFGWTMKSMAKMSGLLAGLFTQSKETGITLATSTNPTLREILGAITTKLRGGIPGAETVGGELPGGIPGTAEGASKPAETASKAGKLARAKSWATRGWRGKGLSLIKSNSGLLTSLGIMAAFSGGHYALSKAREAETEDTSGNQWTYYSKEADRLARQINRYSKLANDVGTPDDARREYQEKERELRRAYALNDEKRKEFDQIVNQRAQYESDLKSGDALLATEDKRQYMRDTEKFVNAGSLGETSTSRASEMFGRGEKKLGAASLAHMGLSVLGKPVVTESALKAVSKYGMKAGSKQALKGTLRGIPLLGTLLSAGYTAYDTEGSLGRKLFAAGGDLAGTVAGQAATGGFGGGIVGGMAGEYGGLEAYDRMFGGQEAAKARDALAQKMPVAAIESRSGGNLPVTSAGRTAIPANLKLRGSMVSLMIPLDSFANVVDSSNSRNDSRSSALSGIR